MLGQLHEANFLPRAELLNYFDAILRVYNRHGRRDNKFKARLKILVKDLTLAGFARDVEAEWAYDPGRPGPNQRFPQKVLLLWKPFLPGTSYAPARRTMIRATSLRWQAATGHLPAGWRAMWQRTASRATRIVTLSLKKDRHAARRTPRPSQLDLAVADLAERFSAGRNPRQP